MTRAFIALALSTAVCAPDGETCAAADELRAREDDIAAAHDACETDGGCTTLGANLECAGADAIGRCPLIVSEAEREAAAGELAEVHEEICARADVTCIESVDCAAVTPACIDGRCTSG